MIERWAKIGGWPSYEISDHGRVRFNDGKCVRMRKLGKTRGYPSVSVRCNGKHQSRYIHRLVATAFVSGNEDLDVAHLDGNKLNNLFSNLAFVSKSENEAHKVSHGTKQFGENHISAKLCDRAVMACKKLKAAGWTYSDIGELFEMSASVICDYMKGRARMDLARRQA